MKQFVFFLSAFIYVQGVSGFLRKPKPIGQACSEKYSLKKNKLSACIHYCYDVERENYTGFIKTNGRCFCKTDLDTNQSNCLHTMADIYRNGDPVVEEISLSSNLTIFGDNVSIILSHITSKLLSEDFLTQNLSVVVKNIESNETVNLTGIAISICYLSPKEVLLTLKKHFSVGRYTLNLREDNKNELAKLWLIVVNSTDLKISLESKKIKHLKNGSIAIDVGTNVTFKLVSNKFSIFSYQIVNRVHRPARCDKYFKCSENRTRPVVSINKANHTFSIKFKVIGLYTIYLFLRTNNSDIIYKMTLQTNNYVIVQEMIGVFCLDHYNKGEGKNRYISFQGDTLNEMTSYLNLKYTWIIRGPNYLNETTLYERVFIFDLNNVKLPTNQQYTVTLVVENFISREKFTAFVNFEFEIFDAAITVSKDNPIIVGDIIVISRSVFTNTLIEWKYTDRRGTFSIFKPKVHLSPSETGRYLVEAKFMGRYEKKLRKEFYVLATIKQFRVTYEFKSWNTVVFDGDFDEEWYDATFFNSSYNPLFTWTINRDETRTTNLLRTEHEFNRQGKFNVSMTVSNIISNFSYEFNVYVNRPICYVSFDTLMPPKVNLTYFFGDIIVIHPSVFINCTHENINQARFYWQLIQGKEAEDISDTKDLRWMINCSDPLLHNCSLSPVSYILRFIILFNGESISEDFVLNIKSRGLEAVIAYNDNPIQEITFQINDQAKYFELSGNHSKDFDTGTNKGLKYEWYCRRNKPDGCFKNKKNINLKLGHLKVRYSDLQLGGSKNEITLFFSLMVRSRDRTADILAVIKFVTNRKKSLHITCDTCNENFYQSTSNFLKIRIITNNALLFKEGSIRWSIMSDRNEKKVSGCVPYKQNISRPLLDDNEDAKKENKSSDTVKDKSYRTKQNGSNINKQNVTNPINRCRNSGMCSLKQLSFDMCRYTTVDIAGLFGLERKNNVKSKGSSRSTTASPNTATSTTTVPITPFPKVIDLKSWFKHPLPLIAQPFGVNQSFLILNPNILQSSFKYKVKVVIRDIDNQEIGTASLKFNSNPVKEGKCDFKISNGDELKTHFLIVCRDWEDQGIVQYEVQMRHNLKWQTILISQTFKLFFKLPIIEASKSRTEEVTLRVVIKNKNGDVLQLCPFKKKASVKRMGQYSTDIIEIMKNIKSKKNIMTTVEPQTLSSGFISVLLKLDTLKMSEMNLEGKRFTRNIICDYVMNMLHGEILLSIKFKLLEELLKKPSEIDRDCISNITRKLFSSDIPHSSRHKNVPAALYYDLSAFQSIEFNNDVVNVVSLLLNMTDDVDTIKILDQLSIFLNSRTLMYGMFVNISLPRFHVSGDIKFQAKAERIRKYNLLNAISLTTNFAKINENGTNWYKCSIITHKSLNKLPIFYINVEQQSYDGLNYTAVESDKIKHVIVVPVYDLLPSETVLYHVKWRESMKHRFELPIHTKYFYLYLDVLEKDEDPNFNFQIVLRNIRNKKGMELPLIGKDRYKLKISHQSDSRIYVLSVKYVLKYKLFKKTVDTPSANYTMKVLIPSCNTSFHESSSNHSLKCEMELTENFDMNCSCWGKGFVQTSFQYVSYENYRIVGESNIGSLKPISVLCSFLIFYIIVILLKFCRRYYPSKDDVVVEIPENHPCDMYKYHFIVKTGHCFNAGTTARVCAVLHGTNGHSQKIELTRADRVMFGRSSNSMIIMSCPKHLGEITRMTFWHNNKNESPDWFIKEICVRDECGGKTFYFPVQNWLSLTKGLRKTSCSLVATKSSCQSAFQGFMEMFLDCHIALSLFVGPKYSMFDYFERMFSLLTKFVYYFAITIVIFRNEIEKNSFSMNLFHIQSMDVFWCAAIVAISFIPMSVTLSLTFRNCDQRPPNKSQTSKKCSRKSNKIGDVSLCNSPNLTLSQGAMLYNQVSEDQLFRTMRRRGTDRNSVFENSAVLYYGRLVALMLLFVITILCGAVIWVHSMTIQTDLVNTWIQITFLAIIIDFMVFSPAVAIIQSILSLFLPLWCSNEDYLFQRMAMHKRDIVQIDQEKFAELRAIMVRDRSRFARYSEPMSAEETKAKRKKPKKKAVAKHLLRKIALLLLLLLVAIVFLFVEHDQTRFQVNKYIRLNFNVDEIVDFDSFKSWLSYSFHHWQKKSLPSSYERFKDLHKVAQRKVSHRVKDTSLFRDTAGTDGTQEVIMSKLSVLGPPIMKIRLNNTELNVKLDSRTSKDAVLDEPFLKDVMIFQKTVAAIEVKLLVSSMYDGVTIYSLITYIFTNQVDSLHLASELKTDSIPYFKNLGEMSDEMKLFAQLLLGCLVTINALLGYSKALQKPMSHLIKKSFNITLSLLSFFISTFWFYEKIVRSNFIASLDNIRYRTNNNDEIYRTLPTMLSTQTLWRNLVGIFVFMVFLRMTWFLKLFKLTSKPVHVLKKGIKRSLAYMVCPTIIVLGCAHSLTIFTTSQILTYKDAMESIIFGFSSLLSTTYHWKSCFLPVLYLFMFWLIMRLSVILYIGLFREQEQKKRKSVDLLSLLKNGFKILFSCVKEIHRVSRSTKIPTKLSKKYVYTEIDNQLDEVLFRLNELEDGEEIEDNFKTKICSSLSNRYLSSLDLDFNGKATCCRENCTLDDYSVDFNNDMHFTSSFTRDEMKFYFPNHLLIKNEANQHRVKKIRHNNNKDSSRYVVDRSTAFVVPRNWNETTKMTVVKEIEEKEEITLSKQEASQEVKKKIRDLREPVMGKIKDFKQFTLNDIDDIIDGTKFSKMKNSAVTSPTLKKNSILPTIDNSLNTHSSLAGTVEVPQTFQAKSVQGEFKRLPSFHDYRKREREVEDMMKETVEKLETMDQKLNEMEKQAQLSALSLGKRLKKKRVKFAPDNSTELTEKTYPIRDEGNVVNGTSIKMSQILIPDNDQFKAFNLNQIDQILYKGITPVDQQQKEEENQNKWLTQQNVFLSDQQNLPKKCQPYPTNNQRQRQHVKHQRQLQGQQKQINDDEK